MGNSKGEDRVGKVTDTPHSSVIRNLEDCRGEERVKEKTGTSNSNVAGTWETSKRKS